MAGFLTNISSRRQAPQRIPRCGQCRLLDSCRSPKMPVAGKGGKKILICGEGPGMTEDLKGRPFVGKAGQYLEKCCQEAGIDLYDDCWITNSIICWPGKGNPAPTNKQIEYCRPNLLNTVEALRPEIIILLGASAVKCLLGFLWREDTGKLGRWVGWQIPCQRYNAWIIPSYHPSYCMREEEESRNEIPKKFLVRHLTEAAGKANRPFTQEVPDYGNRVRVELDPRKASRIFRRFAEQDTPVAVDYETDRLKPESKDARIVAFGASDGTTTIAAPWYGEVIEAAKELMWSKAPKICSNAKFEHRWTMAEFGRGMRNWLWDTMLAAHVLDTRSGISGLKFQAFCLLGQEPWDDDIKPYLSASGGDNAPNRIREVEISQLLKYCALDCLLEWELARLQMAKMGVPFS